ncbi:hypothetical protein [Haloferula sp.]|uniref:hypothetical protein n=1 Tax=Haloferula sp. TaxID=2497595 RepID=UPI00329EDC7B
MKVQLTPRYHIVLTEEQEPSDLILLDRSSSASFKPDDIFQPHPDWGLKPAAGKRATIPTKTKTYLITTIDYSQSTFHAVSGET